jgi:hypothetical protein
VPVLKNTCSTIVYITNRPLSIAGNWLILMHYLIKIDFLNLTPYPSPARNIGTYLEIIWLERGYQGRAAGGPLCGLLPLDNLNNKELRDFFFTSLRK